MRLLFLTSLIVALIGGCESCPPRELRAPEYSELPGPPINTFQTVPQGDPRAGRRSRGIIDIRLSADDPSLTIWNDPETKQDEWGTITLIDVSPCCTVTIEFGGQRLKARPGETFPHTGLKLVDAQPDDQKIWIRSRWTHTVFR